MGSPGIHYARTAARGSAYITKIHNHTTIDPGPLSHTASHEHDARPFGLNVKGGEASSPAHPDPDYPSFQN